MKKKKHIKKKNTVNKSVSRQTSSNLKQKKTRSESSKGKENHRQIPAQKGLQKKTEGGVSGPKKIYSIIRQFLIDSKMELKKVTWPTRKELFSVTAVVLIVVFFIAFFLGLVDFGLVKLMKNVIG